MGRWRNKRGQIGGKIPLCVKIVALLFLSLPLSCLPFRTHTRRFKPLHTNIQHLVKRDLGPIILLFLLLSNSSQ